MDQKKIDQIDGRLAAVELILSQTLTLALLPTKDIDGLVADMRQELVKRRDRMSAEAYKIALESYDGISTSSAATAKMLLREASKQH